MRRLIEDMLDVTRLGEGRLAMIRSSLSARALLEEIVDPHGEIAEPEQITT